MSFLRLINMEYWECWALLAIRTIVLFSFIQWIAPLMLSFFIALIIAFIMNYGE